MVLVDAALHVEWCVQVQSHPGANPDEEGQLFFLPHVPRHPAGKKPSVDHWPIFLFMKGTGRNPSLTSSDAEFVAC